MAATKAEIITRFLRSYPDASNEASGYFDMAYRRLMILVPDLAVSSQAVTLTAGTNAYDLGSSEVLHVVQVLYQTGVDANGLPEGTPIMPRGMAGLQAWRANPFANLPSGVPSEYFIQAVEGTASSSVPDAKWQIWVNPVPVTSSSGGYPCLLIKGTFHTPLSSTTHQIAATLPDESILIDDMKHQYCSEFMTVEEAMKWKASFNLKLEELNNFVATRIQGEAQVLSPFFMQSRAVH